MLSVWVLCAGVCVCAHMSVCICLFVCVCCWLSLPPNACVCVCLRCSRGYFDSLLPSPTRQSVTFGAPLVAEAAPDPLRRTPAFCKRCAAFDVGVSHVGVVASQLLEASAPAYSVRPLRLAELQRSEHDFH